MKKRITLVGTRRMGTAITSCVAQMPGWEIVARINKSTTAQNRSELIASCDVVIDFSDHEATPRIVELCAQYEKPIVIGTTGHTEDEMIKVMEHSFKIPIVMASNFSTGVNTLFWLTRKAAEILGPDFDLEVLEMHHRGKMDAPSGTAKTLVEILAKARDIHLQPSEKISQRHGREGVGARKSSEIGIHSIRGGDVVGDHTVIFASYGERVELTHKASSRETFAKGALRATEWVLDREPGLYPFSKVLGLPD